MTPAKCTAPLLLLLLLPLSRLPTRGTATELTISVTAAARECSSVLPKAAVCLHLEQLPARSRHASLLQLPDLTAADDSAADSAAAAAAAIQAVTAAAGAALVWSIFSTFTSPSTSWYT
jgi:hypothetical protein